MGDDVGTHNQIRSTTADAVVQAGSIRQVTVQTLSSVHSVVVPRQVPLAARDFVGRTDEFALLDSMLIGDDEHNQLTIVTIAGMGGVGKTALAVRWANHARDRFPDGQLYTNLRGYDASGMPADAAVVLEDFLRVLGVPPERIPRELEAKSGLFRSVLDSRRMLIVLDNAATADQVRPFLPGSVNTAVLVTSRSRLSGLSALDGAGRILLDRLPLQDAVALLQRITGNRLAGTQPEFPMLLARYCACLPLALRIMAERVNASRVPLVEVMQQLTDTSSRLDTVSLEDESSRLRTVFSLSYQALAAQEAQLFRCLGLYPGITASTESAAALAGVTTTVAAGALSRLAEVSLIEEPRHGHVGMHDLLRDFAAEQAAHVDSSEARDQAVLRYLSWYLHTLDHADRLLDPNRRRLTLIPKAVAVTPADFGDLAQALTWCETERANLVAAIDFAARHGYAAYAWQLTWCSWTFFDRRKHWEDWISTHSTALTATRQIADQSAEASILTGLGLAYRGRHQLIEAADCHTRSLAIRRDLGDQYNEAVNLNCLGEVCLLDGNVEAALDHFRQALTVRRKIHDRHGESLTLGAFGRAYRAADRFDEAIAVLQESLTMRRELHDRHGEGTTLNNLGEAHLGCGQYSQAVDYLQLALNVRREVHDRWGVARTLTHLGNAFIHLGRSTESVTQCWHEALTIFVDIGDSQADTLRDQLRNLAGGTVPPSSPVTAQPDLPRHSR